MQQLVAPCVVIGIEIMSATTLNTRWDDGRRDRTLSVFPGNPYLFSRIGVLPQERHCPSCDSIVYSRRHRLCGACGQVLPEDCRFTVSEVQVVESIVTIERQRHCAWLKRTEAI